MSRAALVVEDDPTIRQGLRALLTGLFQFDQVLEAANGQEALRRLMVPVDVVLTDITMPDMNGIELVRELRRLGNEVPIIVISGHADFGYAREALRHGASDYLLKPVDRLELGRAIDRCLTREPLDVVETPPVTSAPIHRAIQFIDRNLESDLSLGSVAHAVSLSPQYLSSLFKQQTGTTFVEHITRRRMDRARELLRTTDLRVYEIAQLCGYRNAKTFMTTFRGIVGVSARAYRVSTLV